MLMSEDDLLIQFKKLKKLNKLLLNEGESKKILQLFGIPIPEGMVAESPAHAKSIARQCGFPIVIKGLPKSIIHKSDYGLVKLGISDEIELEKSFKQISENCEALSTEYSILIEKHQKGLFEIITGLTTDSVFGKILMLGLGGIFVEIIKDVTFKLCPISRQDARDMIDSLQSRKIFDGVRGKKAADIERLVDFLMKIGGPDGIAGKYNEIIDTVEINPAIIMDDGSIVALDTLIKLMPEPAMKEGPQKAKDTDIAKLFNPESIGIVGISPDKPSLAKYFLNQSIKRGYKGKVFPINLKHDGKEVMGWRIYDRITSVKDNIDYLYVSVPAAVVHEVIKDAINKVRFAQIISSGFSEIGSEGKKNEERILEICKDQSIRLIGPNCLGLYSSKSGLACVPGLPHEPGNVSIISQSGGITSEVLRTGGDRGIRFNQAISVGNCIDMGIEDFLEYMGADTETLAIGIYAEDVKDGKRLAELLKKICPIKPVVIMKGGRGVLGSKAAASHTGALASNYVLWEAMCKQYGATLVKTIDEFLNTLLAFQSLDPCPDNALLVVSHSGGLTVAAADLCEECHMTMPELDEQLQEEAFSLGIPPGSSIKNPIDIPLGTLAARAKAGDKLGILNNLFRFIKERKNYSFNVMYLMTDNVITAAGGEHLVKDLFDLAIELGGYDGPLYRKFVLAVNGSIRSDIIMKECKRAAIAGIAVFRSLSDAIQIIEKVVNYGKFMAIFENQDLG